MPRKLILRNHQSPGDILMLTAAVRDLHRCYPGEFITDVRTSCPHLWDNNPNVVPISDRDNDAEIIDCEYPLIHESNELPYHFIHAFIAFLNDRLALSIRPTAFKGDIHLADAEKRSPSLVRQLTGNHAPFWIINAGGKYDFTAKWWSWERFQEVVDQLSGAVRFVQIGEVGHHHPALRGVVDLRGRTDLRALIRLVHHAEGVVTTVSLPMHLAAAVEFRGRPGAVRPCVVIAGGREPPHWECYPGHQFLHTVGALPCCMDGGCWKARVTPLGDGDEKDLPENLCVDVVGELPRCMDMIRPIDVLRSIRMYLSVPQKGVAPQPVHTARETASATPHAAPDPVPLSENTALEFVDAALRSVEPYTHSYSGRGVVICAGGDRYLPGAWVLVRMLKWVKCGLPIQLWYRGRREMTDADKHLFEEIGVECVDAEEMQRVHTRRIAHAWALKPYAIMYSRFREVIYLDADNFPLLDPDAFFSTPEYGRTGAVFWPDLGRLAPTRPIWKLMGLEYRDEPEVESGQIVVDKARCWAALSLAMWMNEQCDFFYKYVHGDKETFHLAFRKCETAYAMPRMPVEILDGAICQHDFRSRRALQHRNGAKWSLNAPNPRIVGFKHEELGLGFLEEFRSAREAHGRHM